VNPDPIRILLVEDNPADVRLATEALKDAKVSNELSVVTDGLQAINYLKRSGQFYNVLRPDLILLDLNLPKKSGFEVLKELKSDPGLKSIPVVILTTSKAEEDIIKSYNLNANCFITKPIDLNEFLEVVKTIKEFWLTIVSLPETVGTVK
jgi:CheY-like chemotaxis protein